MRQTEHQRTKHFNIMLIILAIAGLLAMMVALYPDARASQDRHGWWRHGEGGNAAVGFCEDGHAARIGEMGPYLDSWLELDARQRDAWSDLERQTTQAMASFDEYCDDTGTVTMADHLAQAETMLAKGAAAIREVRPAFDAFYNSLNEKQRAMLDKKSVGWRH